MIDILIMISGIGVVVAGTTFFVSVFVKLIMDIINDIKNGVWKDMLK